MIKESFTISSSYSEITNLMNIIRDLFISNNIFKNDYTKMEMCLVEALNNVVRHSYSGKEGFPITLDIEQTETSISFSITDEGISRTNFKKPTLDYDPEDIENLPEGGMGLFIIDQIMDSLSYKINGNKNIFTMRKFLHA